MRTLLERGKVFKLGDISGSPSFECCIRPDDFIGRFILKGPRVSKQSHDEITGNTIVGA